MLIKHPQNPEFKVLEVIADAFVTIDSNGCFTFANKMAGEMFQCKPEDLVGKHLLAQFPGTVAGLFHIIYERIKENQHGSSAEEYIAVDDRWYETRIYTSQTGSSVFLRDITQQKRKEELFKNSEVKFRAIFENSNDAILLGYPDGSFIAANHAACNMFGATEEEICALGSDGIIHQWSKQLAKYSRELEQTGKAEYEVSMVKKNGTDFFAELRLNAFADANGQKQICAVIRESTKPSTATQLPSSEQTYLNFLDHISEAVYIQDVNGTFLDVNHAAEKLYGYSKAEFIGKTPEFLSAPGKNDFVVVKECIEKALNGAPQVFEFWGLRKDGTIFPKDVSISSGYCFDKKVIIAVGRNITERKQSEEALRESEETFRRLFYESADPILLLDDTGFTDCNRAAVSILGFSSRQEISNKKPWDISPQKQPDGRLSAEKAEAMIATALRKGYHRFEWIHTKADGTEFTVEVMLTSIILKGKQSFFTIWRDITEHKKAEKEVTDYKFALDESSIVDVSDSNGIIQYANENFCRVFGYSKEELIGQDHRILNSGYHSREFIKNLWDTVTTGKVWRNEVRNKAKDGSFHWVDTTIVPFLNKEGNPVQFITIRSDITKRKEAEATTLESLERYDLLSKATSDTIWDWDILKDIIFYNQGISKVFGYKSNQVQNKEAWWEKNIYPEDKERVLDKLKNAFLKKKQTIQFEYRFRCANGSYKYVLDRAFVIYDESENPVRVIGSMQDVSLEKDFEIRMEKAVIDAQEQEITQIGMELHDNVNQILAASLLYLGMAREKIKKEENASDIITKSEQYIQDAVTEIRRLSHQLSPASVKNISLVQVFESLIETVNVNEQLNIKLEVVPMQRNQLPDELQINLYRILQEQLNNILKHAKASEVIINVTIENQRLKMRIKDNGKGFNPKLHTEGIGLENIKRRVKVFYGEFMLKAAPGKGCEMIVEIPLK